MTAVPAPVRRAPARFVSLVLFTLAVIGALAGAYLFWSHATTDPLGDVRHRLDRAHFVVGHHHRDQNRLGVESPIEFVRIDTPESIDRNLHDLEPELLQIADRVTDRMVFDLRDDDAVTARLAGPGRTLDGQVVRLGPARGEHDFAGRGAEGTRDLLVGFVETGTRTAARSVERGGVAKLLREVRQHGLEGFAPQRSGGGVVEIDRHRRDCTPGPDPARMNRSSGRRARRPGALQQQPGPVGARPLP